MTTEQGQHAPLPDGEFSDAEGQTHEFNRTLERGHVLLGIYKSSCASSKQMFPFLERLHDRYAGEGLTVLGVSQDSANITGHLRGASGSRFRSFSKARTTQSLAPSILWRHRPFSSLNQAAMWPTPPWGS